MTTGVKGSEDLNFLQKKEEKSEPNFTETPRGDEKGNRVGRKVRGLEEKEIKGPSHRGGK